jgi:hypothetical protein
LVVTVEQKNPDDDQNGRPNEVAPGFDLGEESDNEVNHEEDHADPPDDPGGQAGRFGEKEPHANGHQDQGPANINLQNDQPI